MLFPEAVPMECRGPDAGRGFREARSRGHGPSSSRALPPPWLRRPGWNANAGRPGAALDLPGDPLRPRAWRDDGRLAYKLKRPAPDGSTHLMLTPLELLCRRRGGRHRVLAYITEPSVVRAILQHLHLPSTARPLAPARDPPQAHFADLSC